jgi:hypothetical protein
MKESLSPLRTLAPERGPELESRSLPTRVRPRLARGRLVRPLPRPTDEAPVAERAVRPDALKRRLRPGLSAVFPGWTTTSDPIHTGFRSMGWAYRRLLDVTSWLGATLLYSH